MKTKEMETKKKASATKDNSSYLIVTSEGGKCDKTVRDGKKRIFLITDGEQ